MPTIISHAAVPLALGVGLGEKRIPRALLITGIAASMLPDADVILFGFGATYHDVWSHRGFAHSLGFALLVALGAAVLLRKVAPPFVTAAFVFVATASHGLLDMLTSGGHGVAIFWPITADRYFYDWRPIQVAPIVGPEFISRFTSRAAALLRTEVLWIWLPAAIVAVVLRLRRKEKIAR
ncbi:MAG TPA: metal-dependent hydrolase [Sphingomicrobium sp.]|nr:metal-dependent hydrolase [Sphingomicrobium sp.]